MLVSGFMKSKYLYLTEDLLRDNLVSLDLSEFVSEHIVEVLKRLYYVSSRNISYDPFET